MTIAEPRTDGPAAQDASETDLGAISGELGDDARIMFDRNLALARAELRQSARHVRGAGVGFGAAALTGFLALAMVAVAAGLGLSEVVHPALAFLVVGLVVAAVAAVAFVVGRRHLEALSPVPHNTIQNIKEDVSWLRARMS